jgi:hypothetical protein
VESVRSHAANQSTVSGERAERAPHNHILDGAEGPRPERLMKSVWVYHHPEERKKKNARDGQTARPATAQKDKYAWPEKIELLLDRKRPEVAKFGRLHRRSYMAPQHVKIHSVCDGSEKRA